MKKIWNLVNEMKLEAHYKNRIFLGLLIAACVLAGGILWGIVELIFSIGLFYLIFFTGYPAVCIGLFGGIIYLYDHEFEEE